MSARTPPRATLALLAVLPDAWTTELEVAAAATHAGQPITRDTTTGEPLLAGRGIGAHLRVLRRTGWARSRRDDDGTDVWTRTPSGAAAAFALP